MGRVPENRWGSLAAGSRMWSQQAMNCLLGSNLVTPNGSPTPLQPLIVLSCTQHMWSSVEVVGLYQPALQALQAAGPALA